MWHELGVEVERREMRLGEDDVDIRLAFFQEGAGCREDGGGGLELRR